jgi:hypothetical protein
MLTGQDLLTDNFPTENGEIIYTDVVQVDSLSATDLYLNAKKWLAEAMRSSNAVIQTDVKEAHLIIIRAHFSKGHNAVISNPKNWFNLKIETKDGRYKYTIYSIRYEMDIYVLGHYNHFDEAFEEWIGSTSATKRNKKKGRDYAAIDTYCKEINREFRNLIKSLKEGMEVRDKDDW